MPDTVREEAWKIIQGQIENLQQRMTELGMQSVVAEYLTDDGIAGLQSPEFVNGCASRVHLP